MSCVALGFAIVLWNPNYRWSAHREVPYGADFLQEWTAGDMLWCGAGAQIYNPRTFQSWQHDLARTGFQWPQTEYYPAVYPPTHYLLVSPLALIPYRMAVPLWLAIMLSLYIGAIKLAEPPSLTRRVALLYWIAMLFFPALFTGLVMGQKGTLWLFLAASSWHLWRTQRPMAAGCVWALLSVKPTLVLWLPLLMLVYRQWRFCVGVGIGIGFLWGTTALTVPNEMWSEFFKVVSGAATYQSQGGYRSGWSVSLLSNLRTFGASSSLTYSLWASACLIILGTLLLPLRSFANNAINIRNRLEQPSFLLRVLLATALLSPHYYYYDLVWLVLPLRGLMCDRPRHAFAYLTFLWLGMLAVESLPIEWPLLSLGLLAIFVHATAAERSVTP